MGHLDSHCHLDSSAFEPDRLEVASRAIEQGLSDLIVPGVTVAGFERKPLAVPGLRLHYAAGLHPAFDHPPDGLDRLEAALKTGRFVAVGETGLDKRFMRPESEALCAAQLDLACAFELPVILHVVHTHEAVLSLLKERPGLRGVVHAFAGSREVAGRYLGLGFKLGLGGIGTWESAQKLRKAIAGCPSDGYVLETDAPDLSPETWRGRRNEPCALLDVAEAVARLRGETTEEVLTCSDANGRELFGISQKEES
ncbi:MAG TPA: TatD family hydrolase [Pantanalinema sp.]